jgi:hypothetical protein
MNRLKWHNEAYMISSSRLRYDGARFPWACIMTEEVLWSFTNTAAPRKRSPLDFPAHADDRDNHDPGHGSESFARQ